MTPMQLEYQTIGIKPVRCKPVQVLAVEITPYNYTLITDWINRSGVAASVVDPDPAMRPEGPGIWINSGLNDKLDWRYGCVGQVVIRGTEGEFYPIEMQVYLNKYEDLVQIDIPEGEDK